MVSTILHGMSAGGIISNIDISSIDDDDNNGIGPHGELALEETLEDSDSHESMDDVRSNACVSKRLKWTE